MPKKKRTADIDNNSRLSRPTRKVRGPMRFVEFVFMAVGFGLSIAAFITVNIFVQGMVKNEYESMAESDARLVVDGLKRLETPVETIAAIFSLSANLDKDTVSDSIQKSAIPFDQFDQIMLAYKKDTGMWSFKNLYVRESMQGREQVYSLNLDKEVLARVVQTSHFADANSHVLSDAVFFTAQQAKSKDQSFSAPFAIIRAVRQYDQSAGLIIAIGQASSVLDSEWMQTHDLIASVAIRDPEHAQEIYHYAHYDEAGAKPWTYGQMYEFVVGDRKWELRTEYARKGKTLLLEAIPFIVTAFGFILSLAGTGYIRGYRYQARRLQSMNRTLEEKNIELRDEMTKREHLTTAIRRSESENRAVINSVSDVIFEADTSGKILFLNKTWQKITGFDVEQSKGLELFKVLHPQDQEKQAKDFHLLVRGQKAPYRCFTRLRTVDGTFRAVELAISMIRQDEVRTPRVVGTFTDVEERRRAERALGEAEKKFRAIVENAAGGIFQLTPEGLFLSVNPAMARILGYDAPEGLLRAVKNVNETVYGNTRERQNFLRELEERGSISNFETQVITAQGERIWVNENVRVVRDDAGNTLYYEGSMEDITQRKEGETALREAKIRSDLANRAKSEFLANMSHELRTPLNAIIGFSEIIHKETFGPIGQEPYREYSRDIYESGKKLLKVINEILDIARIEANERRLNEDVVQIPDVVKSCLALLESKAQANKLTITNQLHDVPPIIGEQLAVKQILINLISNAIKFTPHGGRITISSELDRQGSLRLSVTDTGVGLDEHEIEKALSPFGQVNSDLSRSNAGTGLGLTLVDALIKMHDGKLELFSKKGIGTTATVIFPADRVALKKPAPVNNGEKV